MFACCSAYSLPGQYDRAIKRAALIYLPYTDWRLYKAQLIQESGLNPKAVSHAGAKGLAQFMPYTWPEYQKAFNTDASPFHAGHAIRAGAWYMARMRRIWKSPRPESDRFSFMATSYNWGAGNVIKAQKQCGGALLYAQVKPCIKNQEATEYAPRIWARYFRLLTGASIRF